MYLFANSLQLAIAANIHHGNCVVMVSGRSCERSKLLFYSLLYTKPFYVTYYVVLTSHTSTLKSLLYI